MQAENGRTEQSREGQKWLTRLIGVGHFLPLFYSRYAPCLVPVLLAFKKLSRHKQKGDLSTIRDGFRL